MQIIGSLLCKNLEQMSEFSSGHLFHFIFTGPTLPAIGRLWSTQLIYLFQSMIALSLSWDLQGIAKFKLNHLALQIHIFLCSGGHKKMMQHT